MPTGLYSPQANNELNEIVSSIKSLELDTIEEENVDIEKEVIVLDSIPQEPITIDSIPDQLKNAKANFVIKKTAYVYSIDGSPLEPSVIVCLAGKKFQDKYIKQLENIIFDVNDDNVERLIALIQAYKVGTTPEAITLTSSRHKRYLPVIVTSVNSFFNKYKFILDSIHDSISSTVIIEQPEEKKENVN